MSIFYLYSFYSSNTHIFPYIRFYAGAALIVAGVRVGSLCIIDTVPRDDFTLDDKTTLLDLGYSVAGLIKEKRERVLYNQQTNSNLILHVRHNIRTPLMSAEVSCSLLQDDKPNIINILKQFTSSTSSTSSSTFASTSSNHIASTSSLNKYSSNNGSNSAKAQQAGTTYDMHNLLSIYNC